MNDLSRSYLAARAALRWSAPDLAAMAGVHVNSVSRFETAGGESKATTVARMRTALEQAGVEFIDETGIRLPAAAAVP